MKFVHTHFDDDDDGGGGGGGGDDDRNGNASVYSLCFPVFISFYILQCNSEQWSRIELCNGDGDVDDDDDNGDDDDYMGKC